VLPGLYCGVLFTGRQRRTGQIKYNGKVNGGGQECPPYTSTIADLD